MARRKKPNPRDRSRTYGLLLMVAGIALVMLSTTHNYLRVRALRLDQKTVAAHIEQSHSENTTDAAKHPVHISIKWFVDTDVTPQVYKEGRWTIAQDTASYLVTSGAVAERKNMIIYGHNTREIMGNIRALKGSETVVITAQDGTVREYKITEIAEVSPTDTHLLQPTDQEALTLYTCSGLFDSKRFVVRAIPAL